jgi:hypothetical protein
VSIASCNHKRSSKARSCARCSRGAAEAATQGCGFGWTARARRRLGWPAFVDALTPEAVGLNPSRPRDGRAGVGGSGDRAAIVVFLLAMTWRGTSTESDLNDG